MRQDKRLNCADSPAALSTLMLQHKVSKFSGEGIEYIANPDVSEAAGLDNLSTHAANLIKLMDSDALKYNLRPPKGLLLLGVPGTGKTLWVRVMLIRYFFVTHNTVLTRIRLLKL